MSLLLALFGLGFTAMGLWAAADPRSFTDVVADFGAYNPHLIHDYAAASLAFGIGLLAAARRVAWRVPVLALAVLWNGFHAVSHIADVEHAASRTVGIIDAVGLVVLTGLLAVAWRSAKHSSA
ncbi:MAG TPA: hypothetical protein VK948_09285 [Aeromicrobium sp.]|nr:hypothetical protein [Aeromicrobium sp.]